MQTRVFLIIFPVISHCNNARCTPPPLTCCNFTCYTHARNPHALLRVFRPPHRHSHTAATAAKCRDAIHAPGTALSILHHRRSQTSVSFAPRAHSVGRAPAKHHAVSAFFSRSRSATPRSDRPLERAARAGKSHVPRGSVIGRAPYPNLSSLTILHAASAPSHHQHILLVSLSRCLHY